jgi:hypothetical protein
MAQQQPARDLLKESAKWGVAGQKMLGRSKSTSPLANFFMDSSTGIRGLRLVLKRLLRWYGLRCVEVREGDDRCGEVF